MWQGLISLENLFDAYYAAAKGKRGKPDVASFEFVLEENIFNLHAELRSGLYQHGPSVRSGILSAKLPIWISEEMVGANLHQRH